MEVAEAVGEVEVEEEVGEVEEVPTFLSGWQPLTALKKFPPDCFLI